MVTKMDWKTFQDNGLLWWVNRTLHLLGWAIVLVQEKDGTISSAYPARVKWRGFSGKDETEGFRKVTRFMEMNALRLREEADD